MKVLILVLFFIGIILAIIGFYDNKFNVPTTKIVYQYIDQSIEEYQKGDQQKVYKMFEPMFQDNPILV